MNQKPALQAQVGRWKECVYTYADKPLTGCQPLMEPTIKHKSLILLTVENIPLFSSLSVYVFRSKSLSFPIPFSVSLLSKIYFIYMYICTSLNLPFHGLKRPSCLGMSYQLSSDGWLTPHFPQLFQSPSHTVSANTASGTFCVSFTWEKLSTSICTLASW